MVFYPDSNGLHPIDSTILSKHDLMLPIKMFIWFYCRQLLFNIFISNVTSLLKV